MFLGLGVGLPPALLAIGPLSQPMAQYLLRFRDSWRFGTVDLRRLGSMKGKCAGVTQGEWVMSHGNSDQPEEPGEEREDVAGVPAESPDSGASRKVGRYDLSGEPGAEVLGDDGPGYPEIDDALLGELVDDDDSPEDRARKMSAVQQIVRVHSGPLPAADEFARYAATDPDAPRVILSMAQVSNEAMAERMQAEAFAIREAAILDSKAVPRGQWIAGGLTALVLAVVVVALVLDRVWFAALFGAGGLGIMFANALPAIRGTGSEQPKAPEKIEIPEVD